MLTSKVSFENDLYRENLSADNRDRIDVRQANALSIEEANWIHSENQLKSLTNDERESIVPFE